jgi:HAD superfamily hydrolase (TIGR01490 family)
VVVEAAFFDLDKTVISRSSSLALSRPMYEAGLMTRSMMLKGAYAQLLYLLQGADDRRLDRIKEEVMSITKGWDRSQVEQVAREAVASVIDPYLYLEALDLMELHRARRRAVYIVSSSPEEVVRPLAERLGPVRVIATRTGVDDQGRYTGEMEFYCAGENKAVAIREEAARQHIDLADSFAYSDSISDLPMLEAVGHPVAVNPDRDLRRIATDRGWPIRDFRRPVRLRDRLVSVPHRTPTPVRLVLAAAAAGAVGWLVLRPRLSRGPRGSTRSTRSTSSTRSTRSTRQARSTGTSRSGAP